jgi:hypothetical protein
MIKGHIYKILWDKISPRSNDYLEVGLLIKDLDEENITFKIKGSIKINPYPSINDYIIAKKTDKIYNNDIYVCSSINIELPIKKDLILNKIIKLSNKLLTKNEATFLVENNIDIWNLINNKNLNVGKIKEDKINNIYNNFIQLGFKNDIGKLKDFLDNCNIKLKNNQIDNLIKIYGTSNEIIHIINNNLIVLLSVNSISINTLISIAEKLNHSEEEKITLFIMKDLKYSPNGDTCILHNQLKINIFKQRNISLSKSLNIEFIDKVINELINNKYITPYKEYLYDPNILDYEINIGNYLKFINNDKPYLKNLLESAQVFLEKYNGHKLNNEQKDSFLSIFKSNINITIGPAGTGKSEILIRLCNFIEEYNYISILFLTPTGKACHRLTKGFKDKGINKSAYTIHKYNYYNYYDNDNNYIYEQKIDDFDQLNNNQYCIIVIDEMSMVSLNVFHTFINKINNLHNCVLLLLGDCNQLPSIDFGDVLNNLVLSQAFNTVKLIKIFRSDSKSLLTVQNNILNNIPLDNIDLNDGSFVWIKENPSNIQCIKNVLNDFQESPLIITSTNKVVNEYQFIIKDKFNINYINKDSIIFNNIIFHVDDKIMIKKNNYEKNLMNGMIGKIISITISIVNNIKYDGLNILFDGEDKPRDTFSLDELENIELAYIITIHKSQGSEADYVIILLDEAPMLNTINLIYTAITRSKKKCILISQEKTIKSIKNITKRISNLKDFC